MPSTTRFASNIGQLMLVAAVLMPSGCTDASVWDEVGEQRLAVVNGTPDSTHEAVGALLSGNKNGCTATLVGKRTVLTAAHCILDKDTGALLKPVSFYLGGFPNGTKHSAMEVVTHPAYGGGNKHDIAVVRLSQEVQGILPMQVAKTAPALGELVLIVGYGLTGEDSGKYGVRRKALNTVGKITSTLLTFYGAGGVEGNLCDGDSGGPTLADRDGEELVIGVHSTKGGTCGQSGHDMRVDAYYSWISAQAQGDLYTGGPLDLAPPEVTIVKPALGVVVDTVFDVEVDAFDDIGVTRVALVLDGDVIGEQSEAPYTFRLQDVTVGLHTLEAEAFDEAGQSATATVDITVQDAEPPPPPLAQDPGPTRSVPYGASCTVHGDCQSGLCATDTVTGQRFCTLLCDLTGAVGCPGNSVCQPAGDQAACWPLYDDGLALDAGGAALTGGCSAAGGGRPVGGLWLALSIGLLLVLRSGRARSLLRRAWPLLCCVLLLACDEERDPTQGVLNGACHPDGTCNADLVCRDGICFFDHDRITLDGSLPPGDAAAAEDGWRPRPDLEPAVDSVPVAPLSPSVATLASPFPILRASGIAVRGNEMLLVGQGTPSASASTDLVMVKVQGSTIAWQKTIDTGSGDYGGDVALAGASGYLVAGQSASKIWLVRIEGNGQVLWQRRYKDGDKDQNNAIRALATSDGGFLLVGNSYTLSELKKENMLVLKVDAKGDVEWQRRLEGAGGFMVRGAALLANGDLAIVGTHDDGSDMGAFLVRLAAGGSSIVWAKKLDGSAWDLGCDVAELPNKDLVVLAHTRSWGSGNNDLWIVRLTSGGSLVSQKVYGGTGNDTGRRLHLTGGDLLITGGTSSSGAKVVDLLVVRLSQAGKLKWQLRLGETDWDYSAGSALVPGGVALFADTEIADGQFEWISGVVGPNGECPPGCALTASTSLTSGSSTATLKSLTLKSVPAAVTHSDVSSPASTIQMQTTTKCQ